VTGDTFFGTDIRGLSHGQGWAEDQNGEEK